MSETEHIKGKLIPTGKTIAEFVGDVELTWHEDIKEYFEDEYYRKAFEINGKVFTIEQEKLDPDNDTFTSKINKDGTINFEVRYYNGDCSFDEALEDSIKGCNTIKE